MSAWATETGAPASCVVQSASLLSGDWARDGGRDGGTEWNAAGDTPWMTDEPLSSGPWMLKLGSGLSFALSRSPIKDVSSHVYFCRN